MADDPGQSGETITLDFSDPFIGQTFKGAYRITDKIGEGGFGTVYKAVQLVVNRDVAVKVLRPDRARDPKLKDVLIKRFRREAIATSKLAHPNTVQLIDFGTTDDGMLFLVLELLTGRELAQIIQEQAPMDPVRVARIGQQVCMSLAEAHGIGIIHRDLKPSNIFLCYFDGEDDYVKVVDFGIARVVDPDQSASQLTQTGMTQGTPAYMSPEQAMAQDTCPASDLYALGCILYEMLTGDAVFHAESAIAIGLAHVRDLPPTLEIPGASSSLSAEWDVCVQNLLAKKPEQRAQSAAGVAASLARLQKVSLQDSGPDDTAPAMEGMADGLSDTMMAVDGVAPEPDPQDAMEGMADGLSDTMMAVDGVAPEPDPQDAATAISPGVSEMSVSEEMRAIVPRHSWGLPVAAAVAVTLGISALVWATGSDGESVAAEADPESSEASPASAPANAPRRAPSATPLAPPIHEPVAPALGRVVFQSEPSGAMVYRGSGQDAVIVCTTPCDVKVPAGQDPEPWTVRMDGHEEEVFQLALPALSHVQRHVTLRRLARDSRRATNGRKSRGHGKKGPRRKAAQAAPPALPRFRTTTTPAARKRLPRLRTNK